MSNSPLHQQQDPTDGIHVAHRYVFADAANRAAFTNELSGNAYNLLPLAASDVGSIARQTDDDSFWILTDHSPVTWAALTGASAGGYATVQESGTPLTQRDTLNFVDGLTATDDGGGSRTNVSVAYGVTGSMAANTPGAAASAGSGPGVAPIDHQHAMASFGTSSGTFAEGDDTRIVNAVQTSRTITAGAGLTGGGDLSANRTLDVGAHSDGSIIVNANDIQVGTLASDAQHGARGGGTQHAVAVASVSGVGGSHGFFERIDKEKLDGIEALADVTDDANVRAALAAATGDVDVNGQQIVDLADGVDPQDAVTVSQLGAAVTGLDHGGLTGLADDDHPQYGPIENGFDVGARAATTLSFVDGTRTFTLTPSGSPVIYSGGVRHTISSPLTLVISNVEGRHYIYLDAAGTLQEEVNAFDPTIINAAYVCAIYWNATAGLHEFFGDERHGRVMDWATRAYLHSTVGARYGSGLTPTMESVDGTGNDPEDARCSVAGGTIYDEDLDHNIVDGSPQVLSPIAQIPIYYQQGSTPEWRRIAATDYLVTVWGSGRAGYNLNTAGTWSIAEVPNNQFVLAHLYATGDIETPLIWVMGQAVYTSVALAREGATTEALSIQLAPLGGLTRELKLIATVIVETSNSYSNDVQSRVRSTDTGDDFVDWRAIETGVVATLTGSFVQGASASVAGNLPQYSDATGLVITDSGVAVTDIAAAQADATQALSDAAAAQADATQALADAAAAQTDATQALSDAAAAQADATTALAQNVRVNGVATTAGANFNDSTPAQASSTHATFARSGTGPDSVSAAVPFATTLASGTVSTAAQSIAGHKTFTAGELTVSAAGGDQPTINFLDTAVGATLALATAPTAARTITIPDRTGTLVTGPSSAVDDELALFDSTSGSLIKRGTVLNSGNDLIMPSSGLLLFPDRSTAPSNPASGIQIYGRRLAANFPQRFTWGEVLDGARTLMPDPTYWEVGWVHSGSGSTTTTPSSVLAQSGALFCSIAFATANGTLTNETPASTSALTRRARASVRTHASTTGSSGNLQSVAQFWRGSGHPGYLWICYGVGVENLNATPQGFVGIRAAGNLTGNPSARLNMAGCFGFDDTDTDWYTMCNDGAGTCTRAAVGGSTPGNFPVSTSAFYDFAVYAPRNSTEVYWYARRLDTFYEAEGTFDNSNLPASTVALGTGVHARNGATSALQDISFTGQFIMCPREFA